MSHPNDTSADLSPREVVMRFDMPWESHSPGYATILQDDEMLREIINMSASYVAGMLGSRAYDEI